MSENDTEAAESREEQTESITFESIMDFATEQVAEEADEFAGDIPNHAGTLLNQRATEVLGTLTNIQVARAHEGADDPTDEEVRDALAEDAVDILLALGALKYEYDLDIEGAFEARREQVIAMQNADSMEELMEAMMEAQDIDPEEMPMPVPMAPGEAGDGPEPGDNVDSEDYDPEDRDRPFQ